MRRDQENQVPRTPTPNPSENGEEESTHAPTKYRVLEESASTKLVEVLAGASRRSRSAATPPLHSQILMG